MTVLASTSRDTTAERAALSRPGRVRGGGIALRSNRDLDAMRAAGRVVRAAIDAARAVCVEGVATAEVDRVAHAAIESAGAEALFLNYPTGVAGTGFPAATCISVNDEIVHGIPSERVIRGGDLVSIDCGVRLDGWCADAAVTVAVGQVDPRWAAMVATAESILSAAIALAEPGRLWGDIASHLHREAVEAGYGLVAGYVGHGIGRALHEAPEVPCYETGDRLTGHDFTLRPGMTIAIEPMLTLRPSSNSHFAEVRQGADGWTVLTRDGAPACHVEHTIAITRTETIVLTA